MLAWHFEVLSLIKQPSISFALTILFLVCPILKHLIVKHQLVSSNTLLFLPDLGHLIVLNRIPYEIALSWNFDLGLACDINRLGQNSVVNVLAVDHSPLPTLIFIFYLRVELCLTHVFRIVVLIVFGEHVILRELWVYHFLIRGVIMSLVLMQNIDVNLWVPYNWCDSFSRQMLELKLDTTLLVHISAFLLHSWRWYLLFLLKLDNLG